MPGLISLIDATLRRSGGLYGVVPEISDGAALGFDSMQPNHLATYPVEQFTPGRVALTDANVVAAIEAARAYAVTQNGGRVVVPHGSHDGKWAIPSGTTIPATSDLVGKKAGVLFTGPSFGHSLWLEGAPGAGFLIPSDCDVGVYFFSPHTLANTHGGARSLWVTAAGSGQICDGFRANAADYCTFEDIKVFGFDGAAGGNYGRGFVFGDDWKTLGGGGNNQMCYLHKLWSVGNQISYAMNEISSSHAVICNSQGALHRSWLCAYGAIMTVHASGLQEVAPDVFVELDATHGGPFMTFADFCYTEGGNASGTLFKMTGDGTYSSYLAVSQYFLNNAMALYADVGDGCQITLRDCINVGFATKVLRCLPAGGSLDIARPLRIIDCERDVATVSDPARYELNAYSRAQLHVSSGGRTYHGGKFWQGAPLQLASYAEGSEPVSPVEAEVLWNETTHRPRARAAGAHRDLAYADDPITLVDLFKAKASDVWDLNVAAKRSVTGGGLNSVTGLVHGTSLAENSGGASRPAFTAADPAFNNRATVAFSVGSSTFLRSTLADPIVAGEYAALFIVLALGNPTVSGVNRILANLPGTGGLFLGASDGNVGIQTFYGSQFAQNTHGAPDSYPHAVYVDPWLDNGAHARVLVDGFTGSAGSGTAPAASGSLSAFDVGGQATGLVASDATVGFVALLHSPLSAAELQRAFALVAQLYAIG